MATEKRRLIDANAIPYEECFVPNGDEQFSYRKELCVIKPVIDQMPTVDAVEVVRCKDCKHYMLWEDSDDEKTCAKSIGLMVSAPDDFCSYGERRTHDQT